VKYAAGGSLEIQDPTTPKIRHLGTIALLCRTISSQLRHVSTIEKYLLNSNISSTCAHNMVNFGLLTCLRSVREFGHPGKFQRVSRIGSITARHSSSGRQPNCGVEQRAPPIFGRAAITLGIGPYSSSLSVAELSTVKFTKNRQNKHLMPISNKAVSISWLHFYLLYNIISMTCCLTLTINYLLAVKVKVIVCIVYVTTASCD